MNEKLIVGNEAYNIILSSLHGVVANDVAVGLSLMTSQYESDELTNAYLRGASSSELRELALRVASKRKEKLRSRPAFYELAGVDRSTLVLARGINFVFPKEWISIMKYWRLEGGGDGGLLLYDANENIVWPPY